MQYDFVSYMSYDNVSWFCIICHDNVAWSFVLQFYNILYFDIRDHLIYSVSYYKISKRIALNKIYLSFYSSLLFSLRFTVSEPICSWVNWDNADKVSCLMTEHATSSAHSWYRTGDLLDTSQQLHVLPLSYILHTPPWVQLHNN